MHNSNSLLCLYEEEHFKSEVISSCFNSERVCNTTVTEAQSLTAAPFHKNANSPGVALSESQPDI